MFAHVWVHLMTCFLCVPQPRGMPEFRNRLLSRMYFYLNKAFPSSVSHFASSCIVRESRRLTPLKIMLKL